MNVLTCVYNYKQFKKIALDTLIQYVFLDMKIIFN